MCERTDRSVVGNAHFLPVQRYQALGRPELVDRALEGDPALIVVRGAAGSGKSVLAQQVAQRFTEQGGTAVWVRLDTSDVGPEALWQRIFASVSDAGLVSEHSLIAGFVQGGLSSSTSHMMAQAIAELPERLLLILDDLPTGVGDRQEPAIAASILDGLESSAGLKIMLTSRGACVGLTSAAARTRVPVRELRGVELALSLEHTERIIGMRLAEMPPKGRAELAKSIHAKTNGWPLITHAMIVDHAVVAHAGTGVGHKDLVAELTNQVLEHSTARMQVVLCATAVLDEISVAAFASMLEVTPAEAEQLLESAFEASMGYWEDESGTRWYRHHDLIREELRGRSEAIIGAERLKAMCARAAVAIGQSRSSLAIQAALIGESWAFLSDYLINLTDFMVQRSRPRTWLSDIPEPVRREYPVLAAFALLDEYAFPTGRFRQVLAGFRLLADRTLAAESLEPGMPGLVAATLRMVAGRLSGRDQLATTMSERVMVAIAEVAGDQPSKVNRARDTATTQTAVTLIHAGQLLEADLVLAPIHTWSERALPRTVAHATALSAWSLAMQGEMRAARRYADAAVSQHLPLGWKNSYIGTGYRIAAALDGLEQGDHALAAEHLAALSVHEPTIEHWPFLAIAEAYIVESRLGPGEALERLNRELARRRGRFAPLHATTAMLKTQRARLQWQSGQVLPRSMLRQGVNQMAVYAALSRNENEAAVKLTARLLGNDNVIRFARTRAELLLLEAEALKRTDGIEAARRSAEQAMGVMTDCELTLPMRVMSRATAKALSHEVPNFTAIHTVPDEVREVSPLTAAERRAFHAVITHGSISKAAAALFLSPETVKGHMKLVYRKLGVNNRLDAERVARNARMLEEST